MIVNIMNYNLAYHNIWMDYYGLL